MENDDTKKSQGETPAETSPAARRKQTHKEPNKADEAQQQTKKNKKHGVWRNFKALSRTRQVELYFLGLGAIGGIGYLIAYICVSVSQSHQAAWNFKIEHRPKVVISRPPQFVVSPAPQEIPGMMACKVSDHEVRLQTGTFHLWVKNIGNEDASGAFLMPMVKLVPEQKTGEPSFDDPPRVTAASCKKHNKPPADFFPIYRGGREIELPVRQVGETYILSRVKSIDQGAKFELYVVPCIDYFDSSGTQYASCATFRMIVRGQEGSLNPFAFSCDATPLTGTFQPTFAGYCED
jgi:hypothetical protein